tara:strand:- start:64 stop:456 length:393 start_codon:yes stop_codon:yes gene_type:complete
MNERSDKFIDDAQLLLQSLIKNPNKEFIGMPVAWPDSADLSTIRFEFLYKVQTLEEENGCVWKGETTDDKYVTIETLNDYVALGIGYTSYERDDNIKLIGIGNQINMQDIDIVLNKLNIKKPIDYYDFGW